jgi:hypothetical protein
MLRFKQYLIERAQEIYGTRRAQEELEAEQYRLMQRATRFKGADPSEHRIDTDLSPELQQLQQSNRKSAFEKQGYVAPHEEVTGQTIIRPNSPRLSDLEELERMGVVDAKNYRADEHGTLHRPGQLPSEQQRQRTAARIQDTNNATGGGMIPNTPEAKQQRSDALRDYYARTGKYAGRETGIIPDETGQQFIARGQRGGTKVEPNIGYNASGPAPLAANPSLAAGTKMQQAAGQVRAVGGPLVAQLAGEMLAPYVQKAGEETGLINALARGISAVVPNSILAAGNSPAEDERADEQISANLRKMGSKSGRLTGPMGIDIGKK